MQRKPFSSWHSKKVELESSTKTVFCHERDVWFISMGINIGHEEDGKGKHFSRPVIILKKFNNTLFCGIPLSTTKKTGKYFYDINIANKNGKALLSQIRTFDQKRLRAKIGKLELSQFTKLKEKIRDVLLPDLSVF